MSLVREEDLEMKKSHPAHDPKMWKKLMVLGQKQGSIRLKDLGSEMGLSVEDSLSFIRQAFPQGGGVEIYFQDDENWVDIDASAIHYMLPLSPGEWTELHSLLSARHQTSSPGLMSLKRKIMSNGPVKAIMKILGSLEDWSDELTLKEQKMISILEEITTGKKIAKIKTDSKIYTVFPSKVIHLEGELSVIAEDSHDHGLCVLPMNIILEVEPIETMSSPKMTDFEIEEFIAAIRGMNEKEARLILKIHDPVAVNLFPHHHFLGKPCMITNPNGDLIWAAYVEPCPALYEWIISLGKHVEILDPLKFKQEYLTYCEEKLKNVA
jgi:hypothetical protein